MCSYPAPSPRASNSPSSPFLSATSKKMDTTRRGLQSLQHLRATPCRGPTLPLACPNHGSSSSSPTGAPVGRKPAPALPNLKSRNSCPAFPGRTLLLSSPLPHPATYPTPSLGRLLKLSMSKPKLRMSSLWHIYLVSALTSLVIS